MQADVVDLGIGYVTMSNKHLLLLFANFSTGKDTALE